MALVEPMIQKIWKDVKGERSKIAALRTQFHYPDLILSIMVSRGVDTYEKVLQFTKPSILDMYSPFYFRDMEKAILRIEKAIENKEGILIFGDRDVDGVTATAILYRYLQRMDCNVSYRVPEGMENYGISKDVLEWAIMQEFSLIISVDCGITSIEEMKYAASQGLDVIITDHHEPRDTLPPAYAIINPKIKEDFYPFSFLSGAAVSFKLVAALAEKSSMGEYYNREIVFFDIETTGLNPTRDEIIEIGAVKMKNGVEIGRYQSLIKPSGSITAEIEGITHITNAMLAEEGRPAADVMNEFILFTGECMVIGHNAVEFDMKFVNHTLKKLFDKTMTNPIEDTLKLSRVMLKKISDYKLNTVAISLGIYVDPAILHRSVADSLLCADVYRRLMLHRSNKLQDVYNEYLPLAAIGTVADIMILTGENRTIVKNGLKLITHSSVGLIALLRQAGLSIDRLHSREISWNLAPLLNSPGRIGDASYSVELLVSSKIKETEELVQEIIAKDTTRKGIVDDGIGIINDMLDLAGMEKEQIIFIASPELKKGTSGLLANRLSQQYQHPAVIISIDKNQATGSVRAYGGFDVVRMLESMSDLFSQFGGHRAAGGFTVKSENLSQVRERMVKYMTDFKPADFQEEVSIDTVLENFEELNISMIRYLDNIMEPTGNGNEIPKLRVNGIRPVNCRCIGKTYDHVLMTVVKGTKEMTVIGWSWAGRLKSKFEEWMKNPTLLDIVFYPEINKFQGVEEIRLILVDLRPSGK